jgi:hypothetical protein
LPVRAKGNRCRIIVPAQPEYPAAPLRDFVSGAYKQDLDKKIWDWKLTHGGFVVKKTHPMESLPIDLNRPVKMVPEDLVSIRLDYEDSN